MGPTTYMHDVQAPIRNICSGNSSANTGRISIRGVNLPGYYVSKELNATLLANGLCIRGRRLEGWEGENLLTRVLCQRDSADVLRTLQSIY